MSGFRRFANDPSIDVLYQARPVIPNGFQTSPSRQALAIPFFDRKSAEEKRRTDQEVRRTRAAEALTKRGGLTPLTFFMRNFIRTLDFLSPTIAIFATLSALVITTVVVVTAYTKPAWLNAELHRHLAVGSTFFWIELGAIILGFRALDSLYESAAHQERMFTISKMLDEIFAQIFRAYDKFDALLDKAVKEDGTYDEELKFDFLGNVIDDWRDKFSAYALGDSKCNPTSAAIIQRIIRALDQMYDEIERLATEAETENKANSADHALLDQKIGDIYSAADPYLSGLYDVAFQIYVASKPEMLRMFLNQLPLSLREEKPKPAQA